VFGASAKVPTNTKKKLKFQRQDMFIPRVAALVECNRPCRSLHTDMNMEKNAQGIKGSHLKSRKLITGLILELEPIYNIVYTALTLPHQRNEY
jgi:hypothetical protein